MFTETTGQMTFHESGKCQTNRLDFNIFLLILSTLRFSLVAHLCCCRGLLRPVLILSSVRPGSTLGV